MRSGDFTGAWAVSDRLMAAGALPRGAGVPRHFQAIWDGRPIDGCHVLVRCYHGLGDTLQFVRFLPQVRRRAARVTAWVQPALLPLVATVDGVDAVLPLHDGDPGVDADVDVEVMELAYLCRTTLETLPADVPYLHVDRAPLADTGLPRVGIVWQGGGYFGGRSIPFGQLRPLVDLPVCWYVLQGRDGLAECPAGFGQRAGTDDIVEAAQVMRGLDLVITVDSMAAHLAGALGVPVWILLKHEADWRWLERRDDSPWYPTARLFRQVRDGDWSDVIARVRQALAGAVDGPLRSRRDAR